MFPLRILMITSKANTNKMIKFINKKIKMAQKAFESDDKIENQKIISNSLMGLIFKGDSTANSIEIFEDFKRKFEEEIGQRGIDGFTEHANCKDYFHRNQKSK
jgi:hypothetical protein